MATKSKILIVDDDNNIAELISLYLTKECYNTHIVNDGEQALTAFEQYHPNLNGSGCGFGEGRCRRAERRSRRKGGNLCNEPDADHMGKDELSIRIHGNPRKAAGKTRGMACLLVPVRSGTSDCGLYDRG